MNNITRVSWTTLSNSKWHAICGVLLLLLMMCVSLDSQSRTTNGFFFSGYSKSHSIYFGYETYPEWKDAVRFDVWKDGDPDNKNSLILKANPNGRESGYVTVPEDGIYYWTRTYVTLGGTSAASRIAVSTKGPTFDASTVDASAINERHFEFKTKVLSAVNLEDVQLQVCYTDEQCDPWITGLKDLGDGWYSSIISVDHIAGHFHVMMWARDEVKQQGRGKIDFYRSVKADAALSISLEQGISGKIDSTKRSSVERQEQIVYRINLSNDRHILENSTLRYSLPGGLRADGVPKLVAGDAEIKLNQNWNGDADDELFASGTVLRPKSSLVIEVPVALKDVVQDSVSMKSIVYAGADNLVGTVDATHRFRVAPRLGMTGHRVEIVKSVDSDADAQPGQIVKYMLKVNNHTFKTVRNLLIRDRAPDHTTLVDASCGNAPASACRILTLGDKAVEEDSMTYNALCKSGGRSDAQGQHVFWCLNGDLGPLANYVVDYSVRIDDGAAVNP